MTGPKGNSEFCFLIDIHLFYMYLDRHLAKHTVGSHRLVNQSLQDIPASLQMCQENKITKQKCELNVHSVMLWGTLRVLEEQNSLFPLGRFVTCM